MGEGHHGDIATTEEVIMTGDKTTIGGISLISGKETTEMVTNHIEVTPSVVRAQIMDPMCGPRTTERLGSRGTV